MEQYMVFHSCCEKNTIELGKKFGSTLKGGVIIALHGDLGTGKTVFVRGIAKGLHIRNRIKSPSFSLMNLYQKSGGPMLCHIDAYRIVQAQEMSIIGYEEWVGRKDVITLIEWPDKIEKLLTRRNVIMIHFHYGTHEDERMIDIPFFSLYSKAKK